MELRGRVASSVENLLLVDRVPAGFEIENSRLHANVGNPKPSKRWKTTGQAEMPDRLELRDDRVLFFKTGRQSGTFAWSYGMRAVFSGKFKQAAAVAEGLYDPESRAFAGGGTVIRVEAK